MDEKDAGNLQDLPTPSSSGMHTPVNHVPTTDSTKEKAELPRSASIASSNDVEAAPSSIPTTATDWSGPDDPENPHNWPFLKKVYHSGVTAVLSFVVTYGSSTYSPGIQQVAEQFDVSKEVATLGLSLYVLGLALGPMISAGLSETFGRRVVYLYCTPIALLFTLGAGLSQGIASLLVCRFLAGAIGAGPLAVGAGTNADLWKPIDRAVGASIWIQMPFLGPALGPSTSSYPTENSTWRWGQWLLLIVGGTTYALSLFQQETYKKVILQQRAKKYNLPPPHDPLPTGLLPRATAIFNVTCVRSTRMLFTEPITTFFSIYSAFNFGVLFAFFTAVTWVYRTVYAFTVGQAGLVFLSIGIGSIFATVLFIALDRLIYRRKTLARLAAGNDKPLPPEERLYAAMIGSFLLPLSLFWFGWTAYDGRHHWIVPTVALGFFGCGNLLVFDSTATYLTDTYGAMNGASAMSANSLARYGLGAAFPLFSVQMYERLGIRWASGLLGFVTVAMLPIPWLFYRYGKVIRGKGSVVKSDA
jgi:MFS family permease